MQSFLHRRNGFIIFFVILVGFSLAMEISSSGLRGQVGDIVECSGIKLPTEENPTSRIHSPEGFLPGKGKGKLTVIDDYNLPVWEVTDFTFKNGRRFKIRVPPWPHPNFLGVEGRNMSLLGQHFIKGAMYIRKERLGRLKNRLRAFEKLVHDDPTPVGKFIRDSGVLEFLPRCMSISLHDREMVSVRGTNYPQVSSLTKWVSRLEIIGGANEYGELYNLAGLKSPQGSSAHSSVALHLLRSMVNFEEMYNSCEGKEDIIASRMFLKFQLKENRSLVSSIREAVGKATDAESALKIYKEECFRIHSAFGDLNVEFEEPQPFETQIKWGGHVTAVDCNRFEIQLRRLLFLEANKCDTFLGTQARISKRFNRLKTPARATIKHFIEGNDELINPSDLQVSTSHMITLRNQVLRHVNPRTDETVEEMDYPLKLDPAEFREMLADLERLKIDQMCHINKLHSSLMDWLGLVADSPRRASDLSSWDDRESQEESEPPHSLLGDGSENESSESENEVEWARDAAHQDQNVQPLGRDQSKSLQHKINAVGTESPQELQAQEYMEPTIESLDPAKKALLDHTSDRGVRKGLEPSQGFEHMDHSSEALSLGPISEVCLNSPEVLARARPMVRDELRTGSPRAPTKAEIGPRLVMEQMECVGQTAVGRSSQRSLMKWPSFRETSHHTGSLRSGSKHHRAESWPDTTATAEKVRSHSYNLTQALKRSSTGKSQVSPDKLTAIVHAEESRAGHPRTPTPINAEISPKLITEQEDSVEQSPTQQSLQGGLWSEPGRLVESYHGRRQPIGPINSGAEHEPSTSVPPGMVEWQGSFKRMPWAHQSSDRSPPPQQLNRGMKGLRGSKHQSRRQRTGLKYGGRFLHFIG